MGTRKVQAAERMSGAARILSEDLLEYRTFASTIEVYTTDRAEMRNLTQQVAELVRKSGVREGQVHLQTLHTTTAVFVNEWQEALIYDMLRVLESMVPRDRTWRHNDSKYSDCDRRNADSHIRGMLLGQSLSLQVHDARLTLGTWQQIVFAEFDGPRARSVSIQIAGI